MNKREKKILRILMLLFFVMSLTAVSFTAEAKTVKPRKITLNHKVYTLRKGRKLKLKTKIKPHNTSKSKKKVVWKSSNKAVAKVNKKGVVTAKKYGRATITARIKGTHLKAKCKITVPLSIKVQSVRFSYTSVRLAQDQKFRNNVSIAPYDADNKALYYTSTNPAVASVTEDGLVTADALGSATIIAKAKDGSGVRESYQVTVIPKNQKCIEVMLYWANRYANNNTYGYKVWTSNVDTHRCPLCYPGSGNGWNCIGYVSAILYHGGGAIPKSKCNNSGIIKNNDWATDLAKMDSTDLLNTWRARNGDDWIMIGEDTLLDKNNCEYDLKPGDVVIFYDDKYEYKHVAMYAGIDSQGKGMVYDGMKKTGISKRYYSAINHPWMLVFRYTGPGRY